ncbi:MAG: hypothetical protein Q9226_007095 [Calogaya cf. arnoldii]
MPRILSLLSLLLLLLCSSQIAALPYIQDPQCPVTCCGPTPKTFESSIEFTKCRYQEEFGGPVQCQPGYTVYEADKKEEEIPGFWKRWSICPLVSFKACGDEYGGAGSDSQGEHKGHPFTWLDWIGPARQGPFYDGGGISNDDRGLRK